MRSDRSTHCTRLLLESPRAADQSIHPLPRAVPYASPNNRAVTISTISFDRGLPVLDPTKLPPEPPISGRSRNRSHRNAPTLEVVAFAASDHCVHVVMRLSGILRCTSLIRTYASVTRSNDHGTLGVRNRHARTPPHAHMTRDMREKSTHVSTNVGSQVLARASASRASRPCVTRPSIAMRTSSRTSLHHNTPTKMSDPRHSFSSSTRTNDAHITRTSPSQQFFSAKSSTSCRTMHAATENRSFTAAWGK